jgi:hypothetical protein
MKPEFRILDPATTPPEGWRYRQPETKKEFVHYSRNAFFAEIQSHRLANHLEITPTWQEEIEDALCRAHPEWGQSVCCRIEKVGARKAVSFAAMQSFLSVVIAWMRGVAKGEEPFVDQNEADRRAAICAGCENNMQLGFSCGACADMLFRMLSQVFHTPHKTPYDGHLGACGICSCALQVAVWVPLRAQQAGLNEDLRNEFKAVPWCWKRVGL